RSPLTEYLFASSFSPNSLQTIATPPPPPPPPKSKQAHCQLPQVNGMHKMWYRTCRRFNVLLSSSLSRSSACNCSIVAFMLDIFSSYEKSLFSSSKTRLCDFLLFESLL